MIKRNRAIKPLATMAGALGLTLGLVACSGASSAETDSTAAAGAELGIVASTSVYGQIASEIAGDAASVTSIIDSSVNDPHSYEASARDRLEVSRADIVIENGAGYDSFMTALLADDGRPGRTVLNVSELSGLLPADAEAEDEHAEDEHAEDEHAEADAHADHDHVTGFNEHLWYNFDTMRHLAEALEAELASRAPDKAAEFAANAAAFDAQLAELEARTSALAAAHAGIPVAITEPVPLYLLEAAGLHNETPASFSNAIEEGDDVAPRALQQMIELVSGHVALLAYNEQTASPQTELVRDAAVAAAVPVVDFAETLPDGSTYVSWMGDNVTALEKALSA
ncbi:metal ABC transporter solute-binding protein, Zn/Mn family [Microterricola viridarii]|uniref:Zinc/manganese transport system substrate-binding protein n=1 Tax=Microterricola viridarii TaxID=412690 RepID=A0A1H1M4R7_9MICO|nr:zinc ABC transporter substrate-binding protein [Microterricola viridarii]SDR81502.1 zinc/manganese transport system substrate-binding protein [Microterricola viridarii]